jgi:hypothetical protein
MIQHFREKVKEEMDHRRKITSVTSDRARISFITEELFV